MEDTEIEKDADEILTCLPIKLTLPECAINTELKTNVSPLTGYANSISPSDSIIGWSNVKYNPCTLSGTLPVHQPLVTYNCQQIPQWSTTCVIGDCEGPSTNSKLCKKKLSTSLSNSLLDDVGNFASSQSQPVSKFLHPINKQPGRVSRLGKRKPLQRSKTVDIEKDYKPVRQPLTRLPNKYFTPSQIAYNDAIAGGFSKLDKWNKVHRSMENISKTDKRSDKINQPFSFQADVGNSTGIYNSIENSEAMKHTNGFPKTTPLIKIDKVCSTDRISNDPRQINRGKGSFNIVENAGLPCDDSQIDQQPPVNAYSVAEGFLGEENEENTNELNKQSTSSYLKEQLFAFFEPSDNKLAMKLFGSKVALNKEKRRQKQQGKWIIHPCSSFRFYWDLLMLTLLIANLIILPVAISFFFEDLRPHWIVFNSISDAIFIADIAVKFRTGIIENDFADEIILNPRKIACRYMRSWFILDFISSLPLDYICWMFNEEKAYNQIYTAGRTIRILRLAKLLSMLRLLRLTRLVRYVSQWEEFLNIASKFMGIFNLVLLMLLLGHWNACLQFLIPLLMDYPEDSWVQRCRLKDADWFEQYTWALFKAMSHMLSIGYGRFPPISISEAWVTIISMMTGATCYALFVGHAAALIQSFDTSKRFYREKFKQVEEYMAYRKLPRALRQRIADYYEHRYQGKMFDEEQILEELSECLREQIINYNCRALVAAVPFFAFADQDFVSEMVTNLKFEVFQPGDLIIKEGTIGTKMYFIQEGIVDIITKDGEVATTLSDGSYFGEICLLTNARRVASVRAEVYSNLYSLDRDSFLAVLDNHPLMRRTMESVAAERLSKIGQNPSIVSARESLREDLNLVKEIVSLIASSEDSDEVSDSKDEQTNQSQRLSKKSNRKKKCKHGSNSSYEKENNDECETSHKQDSDATDQFLAVPKNRNRKRSRSRVSALSGVSKLFKRGGVFGEHTDEESEAYLYWERERQNRKNTAKCLDTLMETGKYRSGSFVGVKDLEKSNSNFKSTLEIPKQALTSELNIVNVESTQNHKTT